MVSNAPDPSQSQGLLTSSTTHGFRDSEGLQSVHHDSWDAPQVHDPASEGLQSVDHDGRDGPEAVAPPLLSPDSTYAHYGEGNAEKAGPTVFTDDAPSPRQQKKRRLIWAVVIAAVVAVVIAVGVGAGVGLTRKSGDSDKSANDTQSTSAGYVDPLQVVTAVGEAVLIIDTASNLPQLLHQPRTLPQRRQPHPPQRLAAQQA